MRNVIPCIAALTAAACSAPMMNVDECPEVIADSWSIIHWSMSDGTSGSTGCHGPVANAAYIRAGTGARRYWGEQVGLEPTLEGRVPPSPLLPAPICGGAPPSWEFQNVPLVSGTTGPLDIQRYPASGNALDPGFFLSLAASSTSPATCEGGGILVPRAEGTFEIARGGSWGDPVELVVRGASWDLPDGRRFTIDEGIWHYTLTPEPQMMP